jgi:hypothetical protein
MTLANFCDLVWLEVWDDCPALGDQHEYREIVHNLFFEGLEPGEIEVTDPDGNTRRIKAARPAEPVDLSRPVPRDAMAALSDLRAQIAATKEEDD